jgi:Flp pilus assembly pilin Flp
MQGVEGRDDRDEDFARDEAASSTIETALLLSLVATFIFVVRSTAIEPMLQRFVEAANTISKALS